MTTSTTLAIGMPGMGEMLIILAIVVLIFGASRLPQLGDALGKGIKNFRKATSGEKKDDAEEAAPKAARAELPPESATAAKVEEVQARDVTADTTPKE